MSLSSAFSGVGTAVGIYIAGAVLNLYVNPMTGFQALGLTMSAFNLAAILVVLFFAKDPVKAQSANPDTGIPIPLKPNMPFRKNF